MEPQITCFVCGSTETRSTVHPKYLLPTENSKFLIGCDSDTVVAEDQQEETNTDNKRNYDTTKSKKAASFRGYPKDKFRKIQNTLFNFVLGLSPSVSFEDELTEIAAKLCDKCEADIDQVCQTNLKIQKLQYDLDKLTNSILDSVISSIIQKSFFSEDSEQNYKKNLSESDTNILINKLLSKDSVSRRIYKKWKVKFCKAFRIRTNLKTETTTIEPDVEHYEEVICTTTPDTCEEKLYNCPEEKEENYRCDGHLKDAGTRGQEVLFQGQDQQSFGHGLDVKESSSPITCDSFENVQESKILNKCVPKKRIKLLEAMHNKYQCPECGQHCKRETRLKEHVAIYHNQNIRETGIYKCPECSTGFIRFQHLEFHLSYAHKDIECGFEWCKLCKIMIRKTTDHTCKTCYKKCPVCEKDFNSISSYRLHRKELCLIRHGEKGSKLFTCDLCPKSFNRKQGLIYHKKTHTGEKNFTCGSCDKMFTSKNQLRVHERIHSGEKPYVCDLCGLTFSSTPSLVSHKKTHLGVKPHKCDTCSKCFRSLGHLNTHQIIHTGEKPYSCTICQKSFNRKENLRSHEYTHATNKPHKCTICPAISFARPSLLRNHMNTKHSKKTTSLPGKSSSASAIESKSKVQQPPQIALTRVGDKEMKTQLRIIKGGSQSVIPFSGQSAKPPEPTKNVAYLVAGNPGKYIVLKNVCTAQIANTRQGE